MAFRGQKADPDRADEVKPGGWELLAVSAGGRVHGGSVGSGSDAEEADAREVSERGAKPRCSHFHSDALEWHSIINSSFHTSLVFTKAAFI